jgi:hypothetical protein
MRIYAAVLNGLLALAFVMPVFVVPALEAETLTFRGEAAWANWQQPAGLVRIGEAGELRLAKFSKDIDAVRDAHLFTYESKSRGEVSGGLWEAGSNPATGPLIIDGDPSTYWQPDPADPEEEWAIEIDLGRAVLVSEIRLTFPDEETAQPFRQFTVYVSTGTRVSVNEDLHLYTPVFRTIKPNTETYISIPLSYPLKDSTLVVDEGLEVDLERATRHRMASRVRILVEEKSDFAALAEVEVIAVGDNIALGAVERGGIINGEGAVGPNALFDGDMNTNSDMPGGRGDQDWLSAGIWFGVDLGAVFFVDEIFIYAFSADEGLLGFLVNGLSGSGHQILVSDGTPSPQTSLPIPEPLDYEVLLTHDRPNNDGLTYLRYVFAPRKVQHLFWRGLHIDSWGWATKWAEMMMFSPGYPAQVKLSSPFIDLGGEAGDQRAKVIESLDWDAEVPPGTRMQLRSRSGNNLSEVYTYHDRVGGVVTESKWTSSPKVLRGRVDTFQVAGDDWGAWSNFYQVSGEDFKSESPRRFIQLEMILSTEDPQVAPVLNSLSIEFEDALLQAARGSIAPRQTRPNEDTRFTYTLWPQVGDDNSGFDLLRLGLPGPVDLQSLEIRVGAQKVAPATVEIIGDSLVVALPQAVEGDSVTVGFTARLIENATVFSLDLGLSGRPGLWQSVEPAERRANIVMLPELADNSRLIDDLSFSTPVLTPNGDGANDELEIRFVAFKVQDNRPTAGVYDLNGRRVAQLKAEEDGPYTRFVWSGRTEAGSLAAPGVYLCRIDLKAQTGDDTAQHVVTVAY